MLNRYTDEQLLNHLTGLGQWVKIRAQELGYFTQHLPAKLADAGCDPQKQASLQYALLVYLEALEETVSRCRSAQEEFNRRAKVKA